jgi:hypothetical protein
VLKVEARSVERFKDTVLQLVRQRRGRNLERFIEKGLNFVVRGWVN